MNPDIATTSRDAEKMSEPASPPLPSPSQPSATTKERDSKLHERKISPFRFKTKRLRRPRRSRPQHDDDKGGGNYDDDDTTAERPGSSSGRHRHHRRRHHSGYHKRRRHRSGSPAGAVGGREERRRGADDVDDADGGGEPVAGGGGGGGLSPNAAFRESLFDAMADDEGAAYWEGVYGQPIHIYGREAGGDATGGGGELERMTEDEYATFVRRKMWEKTHAGLLEERARREAARAAKEREAAEAARIAEEMEKSLRRGRERRSRREWRDKWDGYVAAWTAWGSDVGGVPWPTRSGTREDVAAEGAVREFFVRGLGLDELGEKEFAARLKEERVRWHPDKVQQRLGGQVDEGVLRDVTAIFQIIDKLWSDTRSNSA